MAWEWFMLALDDPCMEFCWKSFDWLNTVCAWDSLSETLSLSSLTLTKPWSWTSGDPGSPSLLRASVLMPVNARAWVFSFSELSRRFFTVLGRPGFLPCNKTKFIIENPHILFLSTKCMYFNIHNLTSSKEVRMLSIGQQAWTVTWVTSKLVMIKLHFILPRCQKNRKTQHHWWWFKKNEFCYSSIRCSQ